MIPILIGALVVFGGPTLYFAWRSREFRKFLAGAFFVSAGMQFYFYIANVSMPLVGTNIVQTPELSGLRSIPGFIFFSGLFNALNVVRALRISAGSLRRHFLLFRTNPL